MDQRVGSATSQQPLLGDFLSQFYDTHDNPITPSVILWDSSSGQELPEFDAMCSFRDVVATSHVLLARARAMTASFPSSTQWMDSFSIYPWMLGRDAQNITCRTPAVYGLHDVKSFRGQSSPGLSCRSLRRGDRDHPLFDALCPKWVEVYSNRSTNHAAVALFRSLNMAYRAGSVPGEADATNYDYGRSVALWVSAFEILAHPGGSGIFSRSTTFSKGLITILQVFRTLSIQPTAIESIRRRREISPAGCTGSSTRPATISFTAIRCHLTVSS